MQLVDADNLSTAVDGDTAVVMLTHVNYRTGRMHEMLEITRAAHGSGSPRHLGPGPLGRGHARVRLYGDGSPAGAADFAIGCGYKLLNGGPGAPAFIWVHPRHTRRMETEGWRQPLAGWFGHAAPFEFATDYLAAASHSFICGTPPIISLAALECGVDTLLAAEAYGRLLTVVPREVNRVDQPLHRARGPALRRITAFRS